MINIRMVLSPPLWIFEKYTQSSVLSKYHFYQESICALNQ